MKIITHLFTACIVFLLLFAGTAIVQEFTAEIPDTSKNEIHLKWIVQETDNIMYYTLKRKMIRDLEFMLVNTIQPTTTTDTFNEYVYIDKNVFRNNSNTEPVTYELYVSYTNGTQELIAQTEVNYSSTAIRRTWGSIKAMFQ